MARHIVPAYKVNTVVMALTHWKSTLLLRVLQSVAVLYSDAPRQKNLTSILRAAAMSMTEDTRLTRLATTPGTARPTFTRRKYIKHLR